MITFEPISHTYTLDGNKLKSVSSWIAQFTPPFDADRIAEAVAKKEGVETDDILTKWEQKKDISLHLGNWVHESIEYYLKYDQEFTNEPIEAYKAVGIKNPVHSEVIVHNDELAGTIDLIEVVKKGKVKIHDFKTNGDLNKTNGKLKDPFGDMPNSPLSKYTLQLNKYKELLEKMKGVDVVEMNLWHYTNKGFEIIKIKEINLCPKKKTMTLEL